MLGHFVPHDEAHRNPALRCVGLGRLGRLRLMGAAAVASIKRQARGGAGVPRTPTRQQRYDDIVLEAGKLFAQRGFDNTSLQDIGEAVGVLKGSLYHYIGSKEELLYDVINGAHKGLAENISVCEKLEVGPSERLAAFAVGHILLNVHPDRYARGVVFLRDGGRLNPDKRELVLRDRNRYRDYLRLVLTEGQRHGEFCRDVDSQLCAFTILGSLNSFHRWYQPSGRMKPEQIAREVACLIVASVACSPQVHVPGHRTAVLDALPAEVWGGRTTTHDQP